MWDRAILCIDLIASVSHRLPCLKEAKTRIGLVSFVALIHLDGGEGKHRQAVEEGVRVVNVNMANSEAAWHSHLSYCMEADPSPTFVFQVWEGSRIAKPSWAACPLQGSAGLTALRLLCPRLPEKPPG